MPSFSSAKQMTSQSEGLLEVLQGQNATPNENRYVPHHYHRTLLPSESTRTYRKDVSQCASPPKERESGPWSETFPRRQNKLEVIEENDAKNELEKQFLDFTKPVSDDTLITAKIARAILQNMFQLYPDNVGEDLNTEQILDSLTIDLSESDEDYLAELEDESVTQLNSSAVKNETLFADKTRFGNIDAEAGAPEKEKFDKGWSKQVDHGPSLEQLDDDAGYISDDSSLYSSSSGEELPSLDVLCAYSVLSDGLLGLSKGQTDRDGNASSYGKNMEPDSTDAQKRDKPALRCPIPSRCRGVVRIPELNEQMLGAGEESRLSSTPTTPHRGTVPHDTFSKSSTAPVLGHIGNTSKGVITRTPSQRRKMPGNRRAETGVIMSQEELRCITASGSYRDILMNPLPKPLKAWELLSNCDDGTDVESAPSLRSMEAVSWGQLSTRFGVDREKERKRQGGATVRGKEKRSLFSLLLTRWSARSRKVNHGSEENKSSSRFPEVGESSGMMGRLGLGLRRVTQVFRSSRTRGGKYEE